MLFLTKPLIQL